MTQLVRVGRHLTLETEGVTFWIERPEIGELAMIPYLADERLYYEQLSEAVRIIARKEETTSRRIIVTDPRCISFIQLLLGRETNVLMVGCRSIDTARLHSDLSFLSQLALEYGADKIVLSIGSLHTVIA